MSSLVHPQGGWLTGLCHPVPWSAASCSLEWFDWLQGQLCQGGFHCDSPTSGLSQQLYCLLIGSGSLARSWLTEQWCHLGSTRH